MRRVWEIAPKPQRASGRVSKLILTIIKKNFKHTVYIPVLGGSHCVIWFSDWFSVMFWFWVKIGLKICFKVPTHVRTGLENWYWFLKKREPDEFSHENWNPVLRVLKQIWFIGSACSSSQMGAIGSSCSSH